MTLAQMGIPVMENIVTTRPETEFCNKLMKELGADIDPASIVYERIQRIDTEYCRRGEKSGWYIAFDHNDAGKIFIAGDWHLDKDHLVTFHTDGNGSYSDEERKAIWKKAMEETDRRRSEEQARAIQSMRLFYGNLPGFQPGEKHPYLELKKIGLVSNHKWPVKKNGNYLYIPLFCIDGEIVSCQAIWIDENDKPQKRFYIGCPVKGGFYVIGVDHWEDAVWLCEGYATGVSIYEATGQGVVIAFSANNLKAVGKAFQDKFGTRLVIVADNDKSGTGEEAAMKSGLRHVLIPEPGMDANDYATRYGVEALRGLLEESESDPIFGVPDKSLLDKEKEWLIEGVFGKTGVYELFCYRGTGKSFVAIRIAMSVLYGVPFGGHKATSGNGLVYYLAGMNEGQGTPITERLAASDLFFQAKTGMKSQWDRIRVFTTPKGKRSLKMGKKGKADDFPRILDAIRREKEKPSLIIVDTLRANIDGDDSKQEDVNPFLENVRILSSTFDCCVLFVHHQGKRGSDSMLMGNDRGSSIIQDALEGAYRLDGSIKNPPVALVCDKMRDFAEPDEIVFIPKKFQFVSEGGVTHNSIVLVDADEDQREAYLKRKEKTSKDKRYDQKTKEYLIILLDALKVIHGEALESMLENSKPMLKVERRSLIKAGISSSHLSNGASRMQKRLIDEGYVFSMVDGKKGLWVDCGKLLDFMNHQE